MKLKNIRKYQIHEITNYLLKENDIIVTEDLDVKNMKSNKHIARPLTDIPLSEIIRVLKYKGVWLGKKIYQISRYYPSSQICSICGYKNKKVKDLSTRKWECPKCHSNHDRDYNASYNIMFEGLKIYMKGLV